MSPAVSVTSAGRRALGAGEEVSVGSTPTSRYAAQVDGVTEIRPGTYVFSDRTQVELGWGEPSDAGRAVVDVGDAARSAHDGAGPVRVVAVGAVAAVEH